MLIIGLLTSLIFCSWDPNGKKDNPGQKGTQEGLPSWRKPKPSTSGGSSDHSSKYGGESSGHSSKYGGGSSDYSSKYGGGSSDFSQDKWKYPNRHPAFTYIPQVDTRTVEKQMQKRQESREVEKFVSGSTFSSQQEKEKLRKMNAEIDKWKKNHKR